jgi:hypothetical protein
MHVVIASRTRGHQLSFVVQTALSSGIEKPDCEGGPELVSGYPANTAPLAPIRRTDVSTFSTLWNNYPMESREDLFNKVLGGG